MYLKAGRQKTLAEKKSIVDQINERYEKSNKFDGVDQCSWIDFGISNLGSERESINISHKRKRWTEKSWEG